MSYPLFSFRTGYGSAQKLDNTIHRIARFNHVKKDPACFLCQTSLSMAFLQRRRFFPQNVRDS